MRSYTLLLLFLFLGGHLLSDVVWIQRLYLEMRPGWFIFNQVIKCLLLLPSRPLRLTLLPHYSDLLSVLLFVYPLRDDIKIIVKGGFLDVFLVKPVGFIRRRPVSYVGHPLLLALMNHRADVRSRGRDRRELGQRLRRHFLVG